MKRSLLYVFVLILCQQSTHAQSKDKSISVEDVTRIEKTLSSDEMQGRRIFTPGIDMAADFIAAEFAKAGLKPLTNESFFQEFNMQRVKFISAKGTLDGKEIAPADVVAFSSMESISISDTSGYEKIRIGAADTFFRSVQRILASGKNSFVSVDTSFSKIFNNLKRYSSESMTPAHTVVFVLSPADPSVYAVEYTQQVIPLKLKNVVGKIEGKKRADEYVIFSAHYDHLGTGKPNKDMDSIYNGSNDDASGTTAVISLAKYFAKLKNNERTIIFAAFTAEEEGGFGSKYFSEQVDPAKTMAMFNIEMIGTESKWGTNSAYVTGYEKTDLGKIMEKNLKGTGFTFYPDPYPEQQLFYRSDNATLARKGVPAHTISTSKMDSEKFYHTLDDEIETLDMQNMAAIIHSIALSARSLISGGDTPTRVDTSALR